MYIGLHVKYPLFMSDCNETWILSTIFEKSSNIKFHENPSSGSWIDPCGRTDTTKLIVAFRKFADAPKNHCATAPNSSCLSAPRKGFYKSFRVLSTQLLGASFIVPFDTACTTSYESARVTTHFKSGVFSFTYDTVLVKVISSRCISNYT